MVIALSFETIERGKAMIILNYDICMAIGQDAGDCNMRKQGRTVWNSADFNIAAATTNALLRKITIHARKTATEKRGAQCGR